MTAELPDFSALEVFKTFQDRASAPLALNEREQESVRTFLAEQGLKSVYASCAAGAYSPIENQTIGLLLSHGEGAHRVLTMPGALVGPYFLGDFYSPQGIAVYVPQAAEELI